MRKKRALLYLVACLLCASVAAIVTMRFISKAAADTQPTDRIKLLLAKRDIKQGEPVELAGPDGKGNVFFVGWPRNLVPAGGITDKKALSGGPLRARTAFVRNEPIQSSRLVKEDQYVPQDMYRWMVPVNEDDLKNGRLRLGMKVDVLLVRDKKPEDFMRCGRIYAIGRLDENGLPIMEKKPPPNVWILVKKADRDAYVGAKYGAARLVVVEASDPQCSGPYLVQQPDSAKTRQKEAEAMLVRAKGLAQAAQYEQALSVLDDLKSNYSDVAPVAARAAVEQTKTREAMANSLYQRAEAALEHDKDYAEALRLLDEVDKQAPPTSSVRQKAAALKEKAKSGLDTSRQLARYQALTAAIDDALASGDLPAAKAKEAKLEEFSRTGIEFKGVEKQPKQAVADYAKKVKAALGEFNIEKQALQVFLQRKDLKAAQKQLLDMKKKYPAHPELPDLEKAVQAAQKPAQ